MSMLLNSQFRKSKFLYEESNRTSLEIFFYLRNAFNELASEHGSYGNIVGLFFHDLMTHFTSILAQREWFGNYGNEIEFPFVNKHYALDPFPVTESQYRDRPWKRGVSEAIRQFPILPVAVGEAIPWGHGQSPLPGKLFSLLTAYQTFTQAYLPGYAEQGDTLLSVVMDLCRRYAIPKVDVVRKNWEQYVEFHTTRRQLVLKCNGLIVGTRVPLQNRKLAINYLQQGKQVVGMTHGEITNTIFHEPLFGYAEKTLCSVLLDYGENHAEGVLQKPLVDPETVLSRTSKTIRKVYRKNDTIYGRDIRNSRNLYVPTSYSGNRHYGPYRGFEDDVYKKWQLSLITTFSNLTVKPHPKSEKPPFSVPFEGRWLEDCIYEYDVLIFDYYSTAASIAIFSDKPVVFFDIGLRHIAPEFLQLIQKRTHYVRIDWAQDISEQIEEAIRMFSSFGGSWSNEGLEGYAIRSEQGDGVWPALLTAM